MKDLTVLGFQKAMTKSRDTGRPMLVDFWSTWCGPCRAMVPILESLENEFDDVDFYKVNVGEEAQLAEQWMIETIPRIIIFQNGVVAQVLGPCSRDELAAALDELLAEA